MGRMAAILAAVAAVFACAGSAHAATARPACPAGVPTQTVSIVNQAHVRARALARVERAISAQSLQVRAAWNTPCAQFGAGGWKVYLKVGGVEAHGEHYFDGVPYGIVWTSGAPLEGWSRDFSHELIEMLEDPTLDVRYYMDGSSWMREIADPVEWDGYRLDGVYVSDFVLPAWYAGASTDSDVSCSGDTCTDHSPLLAADSSAGPWDEIHVLTGAWQTVGPGVS